MAPSCQRHTLVLLRGPERHDSVIIKPHVDPFVFPVHHGVNVFATGRLLNFGLCPLAIIPS